MKVLSTQLVVPELLSSQICVVISLKIQEDYDVYGVAHALLKL